MKSFIIAALAATALGATRICSTTTAGPSTPTKPASDPFWSPPSNFASLPQGAAFRCRTVQWNENPTDKSAAGYVQYAYKTKLKTGGDVVTVATLIIPSSNPTGPYNKLLSYQVPYDSPTSFCGPSFVFTTNSGPTTTNVYGIGQGADNSTVYALNAGIPVLISDYETSVASFTIGVTSGFGVLNGIEAVIGYSGLFSDNPAVALWGYSGGALGTEFAIEQAASYSKTYPFRIIGAALGGLTPNVRNVANAVNGNHADWTDPVRSLYPALVPYGLLGIANEDSDVSNWVQTNLRTDRQFPTTDTYKNRFNKAKSDACNIGTAPDYANNDFNTWFNNIPAGLNVTQVPVISNALNTYGVMGNQGVPTIPMYWYKGTLDEVSPVADTNNLYNKYCLNGAAGRIQYQRYTANHGDAQSLGQRAAWNYLFGLFQGGSAPTGCNIL